MRKRSLFKKKIKALKFPPKKPVPAATKKVTVAKMVLKPIEEVARSVGIRKKFLEPYGLYKAKLSLDLLKSLRAKQKGKYILVTSVTPTPCGEGKTVTAIGLSMALTRLKKKAIACVVQPSLGGVFGIKGPGTGGGHSQIFPREDANLHLTGDNHAVLTAQNLCAAFLDSSIFEGNPLDIDANSILCKRATGVNDSFLRTVSVGLGSKADGNPRKTGFEQAAAGELMAILGLSESFKDMRKRIGEMILGFTKNGRPVTSESIKIAGGMAALLKDAIKPNILQTSEGTPCFMHAGSFGNIAIGTSSVIADRIALGLSDYAISETGYGADIGAERFFDIKCRTSGIKPDAAVIVVSVRALKMHSGDFDLIAGKALPREIFRENISAVERGFSNLEKQIENLRIFAVPVVLCINRFKEDTEKEIAAIRRRAETLGADSVAVSEAWSRGGEGAHELALAVMEACKKKSSFRFLYPLDIPIKDKVKRIAKSLYGAKEVIFSDEANRKSAMFKKLKLDNLPICVVKTHLSLSHNPKRKGRPHGFKFPVDDLDISRGAGYITAYSSNVKILPGLPKTPRGTKIDIDEEGKITGLF